MFPRFLHIVAFGLFCASGGAQLIYKKVGDSIDLNPGKISGPITTATWKHNSDLALEWFGDKPICYRIFEGHCDFNRDSGNFTIRNLTVEHSGSYLPEINNRELPKKDLQVLKPVPKPKWSSECDGVKLCNLSCEDLRGFGDVTYTWKNEDEVLSMKREMTITPDTKGSYFICEVENQVSSESSEKCTNPFSLWDRRLLFAIIIPIIILVALGVGYYLFKKDFCWGRGGNRNPHADQDLEQRDGEGGGGHNEALLPTDTRVEMTKETSNGVMLLTQETSGPAEEANSSGFGEGDYENITKKSETSGPTEGGTQGPEVEAETENLHQAEPPIGTVESGNPAVESSNKETPGEDATDKDQS